MLGENFDQHHNTNEGGALYFAKSLTPALCLPKKWFRHNAALPH